MREGQEWWNQGGSSPGDPDLRVESRWLTSEKEAENRKAAAGLTAIWSSLPTLLRGETSLQRLGEAEPTPTILRKTHLTEAKARCQTLEG